MRSALRPFPAGIHPVLLLLLLILLLLLLVLLIFVYCCLASTHRLSHRLLPSDSPFVSLTPASYAFSSCLSLGPQPCFSVSVCVPPLSLFFVCMEWMLCVCTCAGVGGTGGGGTAHTSWVWHWRTSTARTCAWAPPSTTASTSTPCPQPRAPPLPLSPPSAACLLPLASCPTKKAGTRRREWMGGLWKALAPKAYGRLR
jgi:hypothetical protein